MFHNHIQITHALFGVISNQTEHQKSVNKHDKIEVEFFMSTTFSHIWALCDPCADAKFDVIFCPYAGNQAAKTFHNK